MDNSIENAMKQIEKKYGKGYLDKDIFMRDVINA